MADNGASSFDDMNSSHLANIDGTGSPFFPNLPEGGGYAGESMHYDNSYHQDIQGTQDLDINELFPNGVLGRNGIQDIVASTEAPDPAYTMNEGLPSGIVEEEGEEGEEEGEEEYDKDVDEGLQSGNAEGADEDGAEESEEDDDEEGHSVRNASVHIVDRAVAHVSTPIVLDDDGDLDMSEPELDLDLETSPKIKSEQGVKVKQGVQKKSRMSAEDRRRQMQAELDELTARNIEGAKALKARKADLQFLKAFNKLEDDYREKYGYAGVEEMKAIVAAAQKVTLVLKLRVEDLRPSLPDISEPSDASDQDTDDEELATDDEPDEAHERIGRRKSHKNGSPDEEDLDKQHELTDKARAARLYKEDGDDFVVDDHEDIEYVEGTDGEDETSFVGEEEEEEDDEAEYNDEDI